MNSLDELEAMLDARPPDLRSGLSEPNPQSPIRVPQSVTALDRLEAAFDAHLAANPANDAAEINGLSDSLNLPRAVIERYIMELRPEKDWFETKSAGTQDVPTPAAPGTTPIGLREQIARMDALDWAKRLPFSPAAAFEMAELVAAVRRLQKGKYEQQAAAELQKAESTAGRMGATGKPRLLPGPQELQARDVATVERWLLRRQELAERGQTFGAAVFDGLSYMPAWMIEFALTGGLAKIGSETAKDALLKTLQGYAKTSAGRAILQTAGWTGGAITRTTLGMPHRIAEEILERRIPSITVGPDDELTIGLAPESWATSIAKGWGAAVIESATETAGAGIARATPWLTEKMLAKLPFGQAFYEGLRRAYLALHPERGAAAEFARRFFDRVAYDGLLEEMGEERLATILHAIAGTRQFSTDPNAGPLENLRAGITQDLTARNLAVEAAVLSVPGAVGLAAQVADRRRKGASTYDQEDRIAVPSRESAGQELGNIPHKEGGAQAPPAGGILQAQAQMTPEVARPPETGAAIWDQAIRSAEAEASLQAAERFVGPQEFTFEEYAQALEGMAEPDLRRVARQLGIKIEGATGENLRKWIGDAIATLTKEPEPKPLTTPAAAITIKPMAEEKGAGGKEESPSPKPPGETKEKGKPAERIVTEPASAALPAGLDFETIRDEFLRQAEIAREAHENAAEAGDQTRQFSAYQDWKRAITRIISSAAVRKGLDVSSDYDLGSTYLDVGSGESARNEDLQPIQIRISTHAQAHPGPVASIEITDQKWRDQLVLALEAIADLPDGTGQSLPNTARIDAADIERLTAWADAYGISKEGTFAELQARIRAYFSPSPRSEGAGISSSQVPATAQSISEPHPGSLSYKKFFERYGRALENPEAPENKAWFERYAKTEGPRGVRQLYKDLVAEWHRMNAWELFYRLTGQERPENLTEAQRAELERQAAPFAVFSEDQTREQIAEEEAAEVIEAVREFAGEPAPADLPAEPVPATGPWELQWAKDVLDFLGIKSKDGYEPISARDFREFWKFVQLPVDIARSFPSFRPVYEVQRAREMNKQVLDRAFADMAAPYFDLSNSDRQPVDELLVAIDQQPGNTKLHTELMQNLSDRQRAAANAIRHSLDRAADLLVERMRQLGIPEEQVQEFSARIGNYIPHKWYGPWAVVVKGADGKTQFMTAVGSIGMFEERRRLQKLFPEATVSIIKRTRLPDSAYQDAPFGAVAKMVDLVIERAETQAAGRADIPVDFKEQLATAFRDLYKERGFGMHFIRRTEVPGWTEDLRRPLAEYFAGFSGFLSKMEAGLKFTEALEAIDPRRTPNLYKYATEYIRYVMGQEREFGWFKTLAYYGYIFGRVSSAATNATGNLIMGWPVLSKHTGWPLAKLLVAGAKTATGRLSDAETAFLTDLEKAGYLDSKMAAEISARGGNAIYRLLAGPVQKTLSWLDWFRAVERWNRRSMAVALYDAGITNPVQAGELVEEAHFHYGKGNRPTLARGYLAPAAVFRSFLINQFTWVKNEIKAGRVPALARSMAAVTAVGGLRALPFAGLGLAAYALVFGRNPEEDAKKVLGDTATEILFRGAPSQVGVSMIGSVNMELVPTYEPGQEYWKTLSEFLVGVPADIPARMARFRQDLANGKSARALEDISPEFLKNPLAAWRLYSEGATARNGRTILDLDAGQQMKLGAYEAVLKGLGFTPDRMKREYDREAILRLIQDDTTHRKSRWADRLYLAVRSGDKDGIRAVLQEMAEYNRGQLARGRQDLVIPYKDLLSMVKTRAKPVNLPSKEMLPLVWEIWGKGETKRKEPAAAGKELKGE